GCTGTTPWLFPSRAHARRLGGLVRHRVEDGDPHVEQERDERREDRDRDRQGIDDGADRAPPELGARVGGIERWLEQVRAIDEMSPHERPRQRGRNRQQAVVGSRYVMPLTSGSSISSGFFSTPGFGGLPRFP